MLNIEYIFWDNDGVLVDTEPLYLQASREALAQVGITLSDTQFSEISLSRGHSVLDLASQAGLSTTETAGLKTWRNRRYAQLLRQEKRQVPGAEQTLDRLHKKFKMAVVTSSLRSHFDLIHSQTGLLRFFAFCLTREDYQSSKPSPEPYLLALQRSSVAPEKILVIEDSPRGLESAKSAGLRCWVIPHRACDHAKLRTSDKILSGIEEVADILLASC